MAIPKINFDMTFKKGELLTAEKLNQLAQNLNSLAGMFPVQSEQIATGAVGTTQLASQAVTASKIASGAVTASKLASNAMPLQKIAETTYSSALPGGHFFYVRVPSGYNHLVILARGEGANLADRGWVNLRAYDSNLDELQFNVQQMLCYNSTIAASKQSTNKLAFVDASANESVFLRAEVLVPSGSDWPVFISQSGGAEELVLATAQLTRSQMPEYFGVSCQNGLKRNAHIEVWGSY